MIFNFSIVLGLMLVLVSCGSSKKIPNDYQAFLAHQQEIQKGEDTPQWESAQPKKRKREVDECLLMANQEEDKYRAYGVATSYREEIALENAESDAVNRMIAQFKTATEGARQTYRGSASKNLSTADESRFESVLTQYIKGSVTYRILKTSLYDLSDGTIQCYVCIEQRANKNDVLAGLTNTLSDEGIIGIDYDRQKFIDSIKEGLEKYKQEEAQKQ